ncbi:uncharacterized protein VTP21DRAFT_10596 [Calcarisporiella thermophila]|uniref:uncharacterized protein n=1 Tax=Calcarisporiella thermophila TaxID=911321 RepID=UPI0037424E41
MASGLLEVRVNAARNLKNQSMIGKMDPYVILGFDLQGKEVAHTFTAKNGGQNPQFGQAFNFQPFGSQELFVELYDEKVGMDELIGFAAIPLNQVQGGALNAWFEIFGVKGETTGEVNLVLIPGGQAQQVGGEPGRGYSVINPEHQKRMKNWENQRHAAQAGIGGLGAALAIGGGLLAGKLITDHNKKEEEIKRQEEQAAQQQQEQQQLVEQERQRFEEEKRKLEEERRQWEQNKAQFQQQQGGGGPAFVVEKEEPAFVTEGGGQYQAQPAGHGASGREWDPVGTYAPGDRVVYHGRTYLCLQGHTSNPTWAPGVAHSLWQPQ